MRHLDDDTLTLVALDEQVLDAAAGEHLLTCARCREELDALTAVVAAGRDGGPLQAPAPHVWDRITQEIGALSAQAGTRTAAPPVSAPTRSPRRAAASTRPAGRPGRRGGRWARAAWLAAGVAAGVAGTLVVTQLPGAEQQPATVARAELEPLPGWEETGAARVEEVGDQRVLRVEVTGDAADGFREVWLLDEAAERLVSVGLLVGNEGTFDLPDGLDLDELVLVDVSREPFDGDPAHSGDSIVRGRLGA